MTSTTPLLPVELPPFSLIPLISPIFTVTSTQINSNPNSPTKSSSSSSLIATSPPSTPTSLGRVGQLVSAVSNTSSNNTGIIEANKIPNVRSVESSEETIYVGGSDGRMRIYTIGEIAGPGSLKEGITEGGSRRGSAICLPFENYSSPRRGSNSGEVGSPVPITGLDLLQEVVVTQGRKAADRIALLERLGKAVILSEGILTFHSISSLAPLPVQSFPSMKGVTTFSLDEDELAGSGSKNSMHICAIKRRTICVLLVTNENVTTIKEFSLKGGALLSVFRRNVVCIADAMQYSMVDMVAAESTPLLPISQSPNTEGRPLSVAGDSLSSSSVTPPPTTGGIDPRQRPAIACIGSTEFLIASHTGSTTLGVFINEQGEPCRGTLEWGSNLRSLTIDNPYVVALLYNNTIEIHSSETLEIVQVIPLPTSTSPYSLLPRSLIHSWSGLNFNGEANNKIDLVSVPMFNEGLSSFGIDSNTQNSRSVTLPPTTPSQVTPKKARRPSNIGSEGIKVTKKVTKARTLVVGKNSLLALAPWTLVAQADALFEKGRSEDAITLARQIEGTGSSGKNPEVAYVHLRAAYISLRATLFQEAFEHFYKSSCDPRLVVRMFPDLRHPFLRAVESLEVFAGIRGDVEECLSIDQFIMANLTHNYSPHMKPNVESASPTKGLRATLGTTARDCLRVYLDKWRLGRRSGKSSASGDSRKVDMVVDTTLVQLLAEEDKEAEILRILDGPNDCVLQHVEPALLESGLYQLQASIHLKRGDVSKALDIWAKIVDGDFVDQRYTGGVEYIFELLWQSKDRDLVERYGIWLLGHDRDLGLKLLTDPGQTLIFDTRSLFAKLRALDSDAADLFLESVVLQKRDNDSRLHADLVKRYVDRLGELLTDPVNKSHPREQESAYIALVSNSSTSTTPTFLSFLVSQYQPDSPHAVFDLARMKTILFLSTSANYDVAGTKKDLEEMEVKGLRGLTLERAIVYGKLKLDRQALSLLLYTLQDLTSSETYCQQSGDPLSTVDISTAAALLSLSMPSVRRRFSIKKDGEEERKVDLARLLVTMCLSNTDDESAIKMEQIGKILDAQSVNLDTLSIIPLLPSKYPLSLFTPFLTHSLRRSLHSRHETSLLKALALSQNSKISEKLGDLQVKLGGSLQTSGPILGVDGKEEIVKLIEKLGESEKEKEEVVDVELDLIAIIRLQSTTTVISTSSTSTTTTPLHSALAEEKTRSTTSTSSTSSTSANSPPTTLTLFSTATALAQEVSRPIAPPSTITVTLVSISTTTESAISSSATINSGDININAYLLQGNIAQVGYAMASQLLHSRGDIVCRSTADLATRASCLMSSNTAVLQLLLEGTKK